MKKKGVLRFREYEIWKKKSVSPLREYEIWKTQRTNNVTISGFFLANMKYENFFIFSWNTEYVYVEIINNLPLRTLNYRIRKWSIDNKSPATPLHSGSWVGELDLYDLLFVRLLSSLSFDQSCHSCLWLGLTGLKIRLLSRWLQRHVFGRSSLCLPSGWLFGWRFCLPPY